MHRYLSATPLILGLAVAVPAIMLPSTPASAQIGIGISVQIAPPALPVYVQPPLPAPGYIWTPGYWAYAEDGGYYWVPGTWVEPPRVGFLWTPPWWGFAGGFYGFHAGYWGPHVGFYGGINYGFGYNGAGFFGGRWDGDHFAYNGAVNNFGGTHITNVYRENVTNNTTINHNSFNGPGGVEARPTREQEAAEHEQHIERTAAQTQHFEAARSNPELRAAANHGHPAIAATARPGDFKGPGVVGARGAPKTEAAAIHGTPGRGPEANHAGEPGRGPEANHQAEHARGPEANHVAEPARGPEANHEARPAAAHPAPHPAAHPAPHPAAARPAPHPAARPAPHPEAARPAPHPAARPAPHPAEHKEEHR